MWQEQDKPTPFDKANMLDVVFRIECQRLPVDHAFSLASAVCEYAPEIDSSPNAGVHTIHVAASQNGWERPENLEDYLVLSKRTRLRIRTHTETADRLIEQLTGQTLSITGSPLHIVAGHKRNLIPATTLFSRQAFFANADINDDENAFVENIAQQCIDKGFSPNKILCGRAHYITVGNRTQLTRSILFADVPSRASTLLQDNGLGDGRTFGCGLFIPHKDTAAVNDARD